MKYTLTPDQVGELDNGVWEVRTDYSGRGMNGRTCVAVVADSPILFAFDLAHLLASAELIGEPDTDDVRNVLDELDDRVHSDGMGTGIVWYWPNVTVEEGEAD